MSWSATQYVKFEDERTRPVRDLLSAVPTMDPRRAIDLGCGPANSTEVLQQRFPEAELSGMDSSEAMIEAARKRMPNVPFEVADLMEWGSDEPWDVMLSNAVLQWLPDHATILPRLASMLASGGSLAIQMPDNLNKHSPEIMRKVAQDARWVDRLGATAGARTEIGTPSWYYGLLRPLCSRVDIWLTVYNHPLAGPDAIVEWFKGSSLRPILDPLTEPEREEYVRLYKELLPKAYPTQPDGTVLLAFPRLFIVATR